jgi:hypothetical protein
VASCSIRLLKNTSLSITSAPACSWAKLAKTVSKWRSALRQVRRFTNNSCPEQGWKCGSRAGQRGSSSRQKAGYLDLLGVTGQIERAARRLAFS